MAVLTPNERSELVMLLARIDCFQATDERVELVRAAGLLRAMPHIDLTGPNPRSIADDLITLANASGLPAIGQLLRAVVTRLQPDESTARRWLHTMMEQHHIALPAPELVLDAPPDEWEPEHFVGDPSLRPVAFLLRGAKASEHVALVDGPDGRGTGFLVGSSLLLTNQHVITSATAAAQAVYRFNYQKTEDDRDAPVQDYAMQRGGLFYAYKDDDYDYAFIELAGQPGQRWGFFPLEDGPPPRKGERVCIIQHPSGNPKQIAMLNNFVDDVTDTTLLYTTPTTNGTSGSPVLNEAWQVVALHHSGGKPYHDELGRLKVRNRGTRIGALLELIPPEVQQLLNQ
ncbi:MAG: trypsin-like peptidase domain-containing protein [Ktedonobacterales bacterium]|nr:trypsin-like peptidase domain-containing protein [Ktedonobacterales bacterium]